MTHSGTNKDTTDEESSKHEDIRKIKKRSETPGLLLFQILSKWMMICKFLYFFVHFNDKKYLKNVEFLINYFFLITEDFI